MNLFVHRTVRHGVLVVTSLILFLLSQDRRANSNENPPVISGLSRIDCDDLKRHVGTLASDSLEGREAGARGGKAAAAYLRSVLKTLRQTNPLPLELSQEFGRDYQNLILVLPGSDPALRQEFVLLGAHYDHVGYGKSSNSRGPLGQVHNGADDNASGTAAMLELIESFSPMENRPARSLLFAFWDAEEAGLLGSKHWIQHPTTPLSQVRFVLNMDMLGRLRDGKVITVGWRSAPGLRSLISTNNPGNHLQFAFQPGVIYDSDHHSFYIAGIPVIHIDTDKHDDYHRPTDDIDQVNFEGLRQLTEFCHRLVNAAANLKDFPRFRREARSEIAPKWLTPRDPISPPIRLGVHWDPERIQNDTPIIAEISPNSPAARAGLRPGDRMLQFGTWRNGTCADLKTTIQVAKNPVAIEIERPGTELPIKFQVNLAGNAVRMGAGWTEDNALPNCVVVTHVIVDSPADRAKISAGDVIMAIGDQPIRSSEDLRQRLMVEPGPFRFLIERNGRIREISVDPLDSTSISTP